MEWKQRCVLKSIWSRAPKCLRETTCWTGSHVYVIHIYKQMKVWKAPKTHENSYPRILGSPNVNLHISLPLNFLVNTSFDVPRCLSLLLGQRTTAVISEACHSPCDIEKLNWPSNTPANSQMPLAYLVRLGQMSSKDEATTMRKTSKLHDSNSQLPSLRHCRFGPIMSSLWSSLPSICRAFLFLATWKGVVSWDHEPWCVCKRHDRLQAGHQENKLISNMPTWDTGKILDLL